MYNTNIKNKKIKDRNRRTSKLTTSKLTTRILAYLLVFSSITSSSNVVFNTVSYATDQKINQENTYSESPLSNWNISNEVSPEQNENKSVITQYVSLNKKERSQIIVKYKNSNEKKIKNKIQNVFRLSRITTLKQYEKQKIEILELEEGVDTNEIIEELKKDDSVEYVQPNYKVSIYTEYTTNNNISKTISSRKHQTFDSLNEDNNIDCELQQAVNNIKDSKKVVVGVLDSGISISHKDLVDNIFTNSNEIPGNNIDDDNNGYIDDVHGWDFANNDNCVEDIYVGIHGTHIAGIIATKKNEKGITRIASRVTILPLKFINNRDGYTSDAIEAIEYAKNLGVKIINCSWGSEYYNPALKDAMSNSGILFICSAGNTGQDVISKPVYPACFDLPNILSVASVDDNNCLGKKSNYGDEVDLAAPGVNILSTLPGNAYGRLSGTSMSAAYVTGVVALIKSCKPNVTTNDIIVTLLENVQKTQELEGKVVTSGIVNAYNSLNNIKLNSSPVEVIDNDPISFELAIDNLNEVLDELPIVNSQDYDKYNLGQYTKNTNESVQKMDGSLNLNYNVLSLKGKNGLDLDLNLIYNSNNASFYEPGFELDERYEFMYNGFYFHTENIVTDWKPVMYYKGTLYQTTVEPTGTLNYPYDFLCSKCISNDYDEAYINYWVNYREFWANAGANNDPNTKGRYPYNVFKRMATGEITLNYDYCTNTRTDTTYQDKIGNIGAGWNWRLTSIESEDNNKYLHLSNGTVYKINITSTTDDSNLYEYNLKDIRIENDNNTFSNGTLLSSYVLYYKDGKKEYFDSKGKLIGIVDRFNNKIKLEYYTGSFKLWKITDTLGRVITFTYNDTTTNRILTISFSDSQNSTITIESEKVSGYSSEYVLKSIKDIENRNTTFEYNYDSTSYNFFSKESNVVAPSNNIYANVKKVTYPTGAYSDYTYEMTTGNLGNIGTKQYYRIKTTKDVCENNEYNNKTYSYFSNNYTGYPANEDPNSLPSNFTHHTVEIDGQNNKITYEFNSKHLITSEKLEQNLTSLKAQVSYEYNSNKLPEKIASKSYNGNKFLETKENYYYDEFSNVVSYWDPQADGSKTDIEHKTTYTYNPTYHYLTSKEYKKDANTYIKTEYTPSTDNKTVAWAKVYEKIGSGAYLLKMQTNLIYDVFGNITETRNYLEDNNWTNYIATKYSYIDNDTSRNGMFNGGYLTRKWVEGIKDANGNYITSNAENAPGTIEEAYRYDWYGNLIQSTDGNGNSTCYNLDKLGRIKMVTNSDNTTRTWNYNDISNIITVTDENSNQIQYIYDGFGNIKYKKDLASGLYLNSYSYDSNFRLKTENNQNSSDSWKTITYDYYNDGRMKFKETTEKDTTIILAREDYSYNDAFDEDNNGTADFSLSTVTIKGETNSPDIVTKSYNDKYGRVVKQSRKFSEVEHFDTFTYDYIGNKIQERQARAYVEGWTEPWTSKYEYNFAGKPVKVYNIDGSYITTQYDALQRIKAVTDAKANASSTPYSITQI